MNVSDMKDYVQSCNKIAKHKCYCQDSNFNFRIDY